MKITKGIAVTLAAAILVSGGGTAASVITAQPAYAASTQPEIDTAINQILNDTNAERAKAGLAPLLIAPSINTVAQNWTLTMDANNSMAHNPDYPWEMPQPWMRVGENVAQGYTPGTVVTAWMNSEGHRANILGDFTHIGLGYWVDEHGRAWFTQNFGKYEIPATPTVINPPENTVGRFEFSSTWTPKPDENITDYKVELYSREGVLLQTKTVTSPSVAFTELTDNTEYTVKVTARAVDVPGLSYTSPVKTYTVTTLENLPEVSEPTNLALNTGENSVEATWSAPTTSYGTVQPYKVTLKKGTEILKTVETVATNQVFTGLNSNTSYTVEVTASTMINGKTASATATQTANTALSSVAEVSEPTNVSAVSENSSSVKATWEAPATRIGTNLKYKVTLSTAGKPDVIVETTSLSHTFNELTSDTPYTVKVQASIVSENGANTKTTTGVSTNVRTLVNQDAVSVSAPTLQPVQVAPRQATLSWTPPQSVEGRLVDYTVTVKQAGQADRFFKTTDTSYTVTGLLENTTYTFAVTANAVSANGTMTASATSAPATHTTPYAPDTVSVSAPRFLSVKAPSPTEVTASWTAPANVVGNITGYTVILKKSGTIVSTNTVTALNTNFTGLAENTAYTVEVSAKAASADGTKTATSSLVSASATTPVSVLAPNAPTSFQASSVTDSSVVLSWVAPTGIVGNLRDYTITVKQAGKADRIINGVTGTTYKVIGLIGSTAYTVQIVANAVSKDGVKTATSPAASLNMSTAMAFNDIRGNDFVKEITWMKTQRISTGYGDGTYRPYAIVTREQMAAFMYRMAGYPAFTAPAVSPFKDVSTRHVFYKEITWMKASGISTGWSDRTFRPTEQVSREQMSAFMHRYSVRVCSVNVLKSKSFVDTRTSDFASDIAWMGGVGISTGWSDGTYRPKTGVTREAMAAFMYRLNNHINANGGCK